MALLLLLLGMMSNFATKMSQWALVAVPSAIFLPGVTACGGETVDSDSGDSSPTGGTSNGVGGTAAGGSGGTGSGATGGGGSGDGGQGPIGGSSSGGAENSGGGGTSGGGSGGGGTSGGASGDGGAAGSGGASNDVCSLPTEIGDCLAAIPRFAFDSSKGVCVPFTYGGCGGNQNNFETLSECDDMCRGGEPTPTDACEMSGECQLAFLGCCGVCEPMSLDSYSGVNSVYLGSLLSAANQGCSGVLCGACAPGDPVSQNYAAVCEDNQCVPMDVRQEDDLTGCTEDSDCILRAGLGCCEDCTEESLVALNTSADVIETFCDGQDLLCPPCALAIPDTIEAKCTEGTCQVVRN